MKYVIRQNNRNGKDWYMDKQRQYADKKETVLVWELVRCENPANIQNLLFDTMDEAQEWCDGMNENEAERANAFGEKVDHTYSVETMKQALETYEFDHPARAQFYVNGKRIA